MDANYKELFTEVIKFALLALIIVVPIRLFVAQPFIVSGASMVPTFETGQYLIIDQLTYHFEKPERSDVIIFRFPNDPSKFFIKRIIGLPGETVEMREGDVIIRNENLLVEFVLEEPYLEGITTKDLLTAKLGTDEYFVMGDNRKESSDSRLWGALPEDLIVGRALVRLLPVNTIDVLPGSVATE
tara:strand:+ start:5718 stop:6272 length:555 start_codon:yes stop_codon:yes gene_type:complete